MKSEVKEISPTRRDHIEIDPASLKDTYGRVSQKYAKGANVPGFRKGLAPLDVIRLRYKEEIKSEVLQQVVPTKVTEAIQEHKLHPLTEPQLHIDGIEDLTVTAPPVKVHAHIVCPRSCRIIRIEITRRVKPVDDAK
jgi:trigger factor